MLPQRQNLMQNPHEVQSALDQIISNEMKRNPSPTVHNPELIKAKQKDCCIIT